MTLRETGIRNNLTVEIRLITELVKRKEWPAVVLAFAFSAVTIK
jgi:hypothetical protein